MKNTKLTVLGWFVFLFLFVALNVSHGQGETVKVVSVTGDVKVVYKDSNLGIICTKNMMLHAGDWIKTGEKGSVELAFDEKAGNIITVNENSLIIIKLDGYFKMQLMAGEFYALLENVEKGEVFRVLTPSAVAEAENSGWGARSDGSYTVVMSFDNKVMICGINKDGTVKKDKCWVAEGNQRRTINFEDPGKAETAPKDLVKWFKEQVVAYHVQKTYEKGAGPKTPENSQANINADAGKPAGNGLGNATVIVDGEKVNLLEYLYKQRLSQTPDVEVKTKQ
ncbi:MAG: FecR domain-containing protein [Candidatus Omnitrophica bacterium]|nr:FecR domain-containing protein [Candidatus Omnitrophota bacterium]